jgi:ElaB/YqjD/DUF883 family membrane-anchored ribosome-binding protein
MEEFRTPTPTSPSSTSPEPSELAERAHRGIDHLRGSAHQTVDQAADAASTAADRMSARGEEWIAMRDEWMDATRGYVREHPLAALGMALAAGYLLSRLSGR